MFYVWALLHDEGQVDHIHDCCLSHNKPWPQWLRMGKDHRDFFSKKTENWMYMLRTEKGSLFILDIYFESLKFFQFIKHLNCISKNKPLPAYIFPKFCGKYSKVGHQKVLDHWPLTYLSTVPKASTCRHPPSPQMKHIFK